MRKLFLITIVVLVATVQYSFGQATTKNLPYQASLDKLNEYLKTYENDKYQGVEVKDGYVFCRIFGSYYQMSIADLGEVTMYNQKHPKLSCKNDSECAYYSGSDAHNKGIIFITSSGTDYAKLKTLVENFLRELKADKTLIAGKSLKQIPAPEPIAATPKTTTTESKPTTTPSEYKINYGEKLVYPQEAIDKLRAPYLAVEEKNKKLHQQYVEEFKKSGNGASSTQQALADLNKFLSNYTNTKPLHLNGNIIEWYQISGEFTYIAAENLGEVQIDNYSRDFGSVRVNCKGTSPCFFKVEYGKPGKPIFSYISVKITSAADVKVLKKRLDSFIASLGSATSNAPGKPKEINASFNYQLTSLNGQPKAGQAATYEATPITITVSGSKMMISKYGSFTITGFKQNKNGSFGYGLSGSNTFVEFHVTSDNSRAVLYTADGKGSVQFSKQPFKTDNDTNKSHAQTLKGFGNTNTNNNLSLLKQTQELSLYKDSVSNKYGFKGLFGRVAVEPKYDEAVKFAGGMARVKLNGKWGYIDATGKEVIPPKYERAEDFTNGKGKVTLNGKNFYIDKTGKKIE